VSALFQVTRADGRSDAQVIIDLVKDGIAGTLYTHETLREALAADSPREFRQHEVSGAVGRANKRLLREHQRRLHAIIGMGYRLAPASEHMRLAGGDRRRADAQLRKGLETLRHVRWEEMAPDARKAHEGHLMVTEALYQAQVAQDRRLRKVEAAIQAITAG
jgi:hypothetical protein